MTTIFKHTTLLLLLVYFCACGSDTNKTNDAALQDSIPGSDSTALIRGENLGYLQSYDRAMELWKIPFTERDLKTSFGTAHVIISGPADAAPLVLLHGMNASSTMWYPNVKAFAERYRVYAIDFLLEPGKSLCQAEVSSTDEIVKWYYEIFDQLQLEKFGIVGASRGGWLAVNIALHQQSRISRIALLSPAQTFTWIKPRKRILTNIVYSLNPKRRKLRNVLETMTFNVDNIRQAYINQYYIATTNAKVSKCMLQMTPFSDDQLASLKVPVLVLIGDNDIINNENGLERAKKLIPGVETGVVKNAGHFLSIDQSEVVDKLVMDFLSGSSRLSAKK
ncbi:MAG: Alpha/beta hydrolase [Bacteroidetes bacterium]|nr:Alpha/beta hydrolase [Bacteroidota bacterium]